MADANAEVRRGRRTTAQPSPERQNKPCRYSYFNPKMVVTRDASGDPVSLYGDDSWCYRAQATDGTSPQTLHFWAEGGDARKPDLAERIREQHKALMWVVADRGDCKAFKTLQIYTFTVREWCSYANEKGVDLFTALMDIETVGEKCESMARNGLATTASLVKALWRHRADLLGPGVQVQREKIIQKIRGAQAVLPEHRQTPLIPSRIYCAILAGLVDGLDAIERNLDVLLLALRTTIEATRAAKRDLPEGSQRQLLLAREAALADSVGRLRAMGWTHGSSHHHLILGAVLHVQVHLMHAVVAFSGMRLGEVKILPLEGVCEDFKDRGKTHHVIKGYTHKLNGGAKKPCEWITSDQGARAIRIAVRIGRALRALHDTAPARGQQALLFPSTADPFRKMNTKSFLTGKARMAAAICSAISAEDLHELNQLELERGWDRDGIEVGRPWPLTMHQLRRSLSVYAHRSGMVSLPALKAQLQHISDEMRVYYADGWSRAVNLVFDQDHFSHEWNAAKTESSYFGLTDALRVAFEDGDELLGLGAQRMLPIVSSRSHRETLALLKSGTIAYRETVFGGCVSTEECKAMPLDPINFQCVESNCVNLVVHGKRLDFVIRIQEGLVAELASSREVGVEQRLEAEHLRRMMLARDRLQRVKVDEAGAG